MGLVSVYMAYKLGKGSGRRSDDVFVLGFLVLALPIAGLVAVSWLLGGVATIVLLTIVAAVVG